MWPQKYIKSASSNYQSRLTIICTSVEVTVQPMAIQMHGAYQQLVLVVISLPFQCCSDIAKQLCCKCKQGSIMIILEQALYLERKAADHHRMGLRMCAGLN